MRVYLPGDIAALDQYLSGAWEPVHGYAVTPRLIEISAADDDELLAEQARDSAATDSVTSLASSRRMVLVVEYPRADVTPAATGHPAAVSLTGKVTADAIVCAFADEPDAAADAVRAAEGDEEALASLDQRDLLWYDVSELPHLA